MMPGFRARQVDTNAYKCIYRSKILLRNGMPPEFPRLLTQQVYGFAVCLIIGMLFV